MAGPQSRAAALRSVEVRRQQVDLILLVRTGGLGILDVLEDVVPEHLRAGAGAFRLERLLRLAHGIGPSLAGRITDRARANPTAMVRDLPRGRRELVAAAVLELAPRRAHVRRPTRGPRR